MAGFGLAAGLQADDNAGATAAREAAEALAAAAADVKALAGAETPLLAVAVIVLRQAQATAERLYERQISAALLMEAGRVGARPPGSAAPALRLVR
jgi:hypothetical protein